jgi:hypothetical protein
VTSPGRTADDELLDTLALEHGPSEIPFAAAVLTCAGLSAEEMQDYWERFAEALRKLSALATLTALWHEHYDEADLPAGMSHQEGAIQLACDEADQARRALVSGAGS